MISTFINSLKIDLSYSTNSFIYYIRKLPFIRNIVSEDAYKDKSIKLIAGIISFIFSLAKALFYKYIYFTIILFIAKSISNNTFTFYHMLFFLSIIGMFINTKLLDTSQKKYLSIVIFNMDAKKYLISHLFNVLISNFILNGICLSILSNNIKFNLLFVFLITFFRIIGDAFNIWYFKNKGNFWYNNTLVYFSLLATLLFLCFTPYFGFIINSDIIIISLIISIFIGFISLIYIYSVNDYKLIFKRINTFKNVMNHDNNTRESIVDVNSRDIAINDSKIKNKTGYDYFNTIFFERHKSILLRSCMNFSTVIFLAYIVISYLVIKDESTALMVSNFFNNKISWFIIFMYIINRGSIITQAMFYNCDHAMLKYNFYREPSVIIGLFKKRLFTIIKVNLIPAIVVALGNITLLYLTKCSNLLEYFGSSIFVILLSIFFSVHYLVIYYLLQPYDENLKIKSLSYSVISTITFFACFFLLKVVVSSIVFSIFGLIFSLLYIFIGINIVKKYAPITFKIR